MDLFGLAASNVLALEERFAELKCTLAPAHADRMERFASRVNEDGRVSINMRQMAQVSFLAFDRRQNIYEWAAARAQHSRKSREEILRDHLGDLYPKRVAFDRHFDRGSSFGTGL